MATSNGFQTSVKKAADAMFDDLSSVAQNAQSAAQAAQDAASDVADELKTGAKKHPVAAAGILLGVGALLGAGLHALLRPRPTAGQVLLQALKNGASATTDTLSSGLLKARRAIG
ncbi:MAG: hypothetical protein QM817_01180 [Archangium sp.]